MPWNSPEEALTAYELKATAKRTNDQTDVDWMVEWKIQGEQLWNLYVNASTFTHTATALAIMGYRQAVERLGNWVERALQVVFQTKDPAFIPGAYDAKLVFHWLLHGEPDLAFLQQQAESWPLPDVTELNFVLSQCTRWIEAGQLPAARILLANLCPSTPALIRSTGGLTPVAALDLALAILEGQTPSQSDRERFCRLLGRLRKDFFPKGMFADIVPWARLYNRLLVGESDPWVVMSWFQHDPSAVQPASRA